MEHPKRDTTYPSVSLIRFPELVQRIQGSINMNAVIQRLKVHFELGVVKDIDYG